MALDKVTTKVIADDAITGAKLANDIAITTTGALTGTTGDFNWDSNTLVVDSSESRVGIGEASPAYALDCKSAADGTWAARVWNTDSGNPSGLLARTTDDNGTGHIFAAYSGSSYKFAITPSGNVGIGTAAPSNSLHVKNTSGNSQLRLDYNGAFSEISCNANMYFQPSGVTKMTILSSGNVGIGTSSPVGFTPSLEVHGTQPAICASKDSTNFWNTIVGSGSVNTLIDDSAHWEISTASNSGGTGEVERMRIDSSGHIKWSGGAVTNTDGGTLGQNGEVSLSRAGTGALDHLHFINGNGGVGWIRTSGSGCTYNSGSDYRLKENVIAMSSSIDRLKLLKPSRFNFIADSDTTLDGFLAHEAQEVVPESVSGEKDAMKTEEYEVTPAVEEVRDDEGNVTTEAVPAVMGEREVPDMQGIDQSKLVPLLVGALQEAIARIETLENA